MTKAAATEHRTRRSRAAGVVSVLREICAASLAQRTFGLVTVLIVAGALTAASLTAGKAAAAERAVMRNVDSYDTRTINVRVMKAPGELNGETVDLISQLPHVESVVASSDVEDYRTGGLPGAPQLGVRTVIGRIGQKPLNKLSPYGFVIVSSRAAREAGLPGPRGSLSHPHTPELQIAGPVDTPTFLADWEPVAWTTPKAADPRAIRVDIIRIVCADAAAVGLVTDIVKGFTKHNPAGTIDIETSSTLATLRTAIAGEMSRQSEGWIAGVLLGATVAIALNVAAFTLIRRKDFGRRRALGATRSMLTALVVGQVALASVVGVVLAAVGVTAHALLTGQPGIPPVFLIACGLLLTLAGALAAAVPAVRAATRDPLAELRVP